MKNIRSQLNVKATANLNIEEDLKVPDPSPETAKAILNIDEKEQDEDTEGDD